MTTPTGGTPTPGRVTTYRVELPRAAIVPTDRNRFEATEYAEHRRGWRGRYLGVRDVVLGTTLANARLETEKLSKLKALAVFSSDALSSVAYATQEILFVLVLAGSGAISLSLPIAAAIATLLAIVIASYRQTVRAYPGGGGAYIVSRANLGVAPGLTAAAALLIDYVLTVSVSVAAGMDALASLDPHFRPLAVPLSVGIVGVVALINLRGVSESGTIFSIPTYAFVVTLALAIAVALGKIVAAGENPFAAGTPSPGEIGDGPFRDVTVLLVLKAFANGCTALTGVEAISNGVQAFKRPAAKNASQTLLAMGLILGTLFLGLTLVARHHGFVPHEDSTIPSQLGATAFGDGSILFGFLQIMTAGILILAANTSFADFPRLSAILARDGYMPRVFHLRGNRLVFSWGVVVLAALSSALLIVFDAETTRLIPLYALGVFLSFTLSQGGMVRHWWRFREAGWRRSAAVNGLGAVATAVVFGVILEAKLVEGAWVVVVLIPLLAFGASRVGHFYASVSRSLHVAPESVLPLRAEGRSGVPAVVPVEEVNLASVMAMAAACKTSRDVTAVHVLIDPDEPSDLAGRWGHQFPNVPLVVIDSPFRTVADPIAVYLGDRLREPPHQVRLVLPVVQVMRWYQRPLVNQSLKKLTSLVRDNRRIQVEVVPYSVGGRGRKVKGQPV